MKASREKALREKPLNAKQIATAIQLNVEAMYEDSIPFDYFQGTQRRLWDMAQAKGLVTDVCEMLLPKHLPLAV